jgi:hypothetical protein
MIKAVTKMPWERLKISRSTYFRQKRADKASIHNKTVMHGVIGLEGLDSNMVLADVEEAKTVHAAVSRALVQEFMHAVHCGTIPGSMSPNQAHAIFEALKKVGYR